MVKWMGVEMLLWLNWVLYRGLILLNIQVSAMDNR